MAKKIVNRKYFVKWSDPKAIKRTWGPFLFDTKTGITEQAYPWWSKAIHYIQHHVAYLKMFELIEIIEPRHFVVPSVKVIPIMPTIPEEGPIVVVKNTKQKEYVETLQKMTELQKEDSVFENDRGPSSDKIVEEFHQKESKKRGRPLKKSINDTVTEK